MGSYAAILARPVWRAGPASYGGRQSIMTESSRTQHFTNAGVTNFYYAFVFLPPEKRRAIEAVYAFARRGDDLTDSGLSSSEAAAGLDLFRRDLAVCYAGDVKDTPELRALAESIQQFKIPRQPFED